MSIATFAQFCNPLSRLHCTVLQPFMHPIAVHFSPTWYPGCRARQMWLSSLPLSRRFAAALTYSEQAAALTDCALCDFFQVVTYSALLIVPQVFFDLF